MSRITRVAVIALLLLALAGTVSADTGLLTLHSAPTGGGGALSAGDYALIGVIGQPAASPLQTGEFKLTSGVLTSGHASDQLFLPMVRR